MQTPSHTKMPRLAALLALGLPFLPLVAHAQPGPVAAAGYSLTPFGTTPAGFTGPDSIAVFGGNVFIGYGDQGGKSGGGVSTIAEFSGNGSTLLNTFTVSGHNDGLKVDPSTGLLWALQNEDGNPALAVIDTAAKTGNIQNYSLPAVNGGGYDDVAFQNGSIYLSASNASKDPNTDPAIVQATLTNGVFTTKQILAGNTLANGGTTPLNLIDADSLTLTPDGSLFLTDQTANQVITVGNPGTPFQFVSALGTSYNGVRTPVDDTLFTGGQLGTLLVSSTGSNTVYAIKGSFTSGVFSAANDAGVVGALDLTTGSLSPIATGFNGPHGLGFIPDPVPEASTTVSLGLLLSLGLGGFVVSARKKSRAS